VRHLLTIALAILVVETSCKKETAKLPAATSTGANTFGCLVNGKAWIATGRGVFSGINPTSGGFFGEVDSTVSIYINAFGENDEIAIYLKKTIAVGTYQLDRNTDIKPSAVLPQASYGMYALLYDHEYVTDSIHTGVVNITHADLGTGIVSGTFEMRLYQRNTGKIINITSGRFDYKTHP
jgi:uncharacterized protein DUF6252